MEIRGRTFSRRLGNVKRCIGNSHRERSGLAVLCLAVFYLLMLSPQERKLLIGILLLLLLGAAVKGWRNKAEQVDIPQEEIPGLESAPKSGSTTIDQSQQCAMLLIPFT